jgi:hypothetical protein
MKVYANALLMNSSSSPRTTKARSAVDSSDTAACPSLPWRAGPPTKAPIDGQRIVRVWEANCAPFQNPKNSSDATARRWRHVRMPGKWTILHFAQSNPADPVWVALLLSFGASPTRSMLSETSLSKRERDEADE